MLEVEPEEDYQPATFSLRAGGQSHGPLDVGVRLKGGIGSFRPLSQKAAFKLKFDELVDDQTFFGLEKLTLNNMVQDPTMVHETLAYETFRALGVPASRTGYAFLRVNGVPFGLYLNIEALDSVALPRWFTSTRHLYEGAYGTDVTPGGAAAPNNYYLHSGDTGADAWIFRMLPWGTDWTWETRLGFGQKGGLLLNRCLADLSCAAMYRAALIEVRDSILARDLDSRALELAATVAPWQGLESAPRREHSAAAVAAALAVTRAFIADRPRELVEWLRPTPPGSVGVVAAVPSAAPPPSARLRVGAPKLVAGEVVTRSSCPGPGSSSSASRRGCAGAPSRPARPGQDRLLAGCGRPSIRFASARSSWALAGLSASFPAPCVDLLAPSAASAPRLPRWDSGC